MSNNRMTNYFRDEVIKLAVSDTMKQPREKYRQLADQLYNDIVDAEIGKHQKMVDEAPAGYFTEGTNFHLSYKCKVRDEREKRTYIGMSQPRRLPAFIQNGGIHLDNRVFVKRLLKVFKEKSLLDKNTRALRTTLHQVLYTYSSKTKLLEDHPYLEKYLPKPEPVAKPIAILAKEVESLMACVRKGTKPCTSK